MSNQTYTKPITKTIPAIPKEAQPFYFKAGERTVIFIHGFSDSLCRVNGFAKFLAEHGITAKGILLPGHGTTVEELAKTSPKEWYAEVEREVMAEAKRSKEIYLIGISFGGNLALKCAAEHPDVVGGVVTIETPMRVKRQNLMKVGIPVLGGLGMVNWNKRFLRKINHPDKEIIFKQGVHDKMPLVNVAQIIDFIEHRQKFLKKVKCDVLVIQSQTSNLITKNSAAQLLSAISSKRKEAFWIENVYHAFLTDAAKKQIFFKAAEFFNLPT